MTTSTAARLILAVTFAIVVLLARASEVGAFGTVTHQTLNGAAASASGLNDYLVRELGLANGLETSVGGSSIQTWIEQGGVFEDQAFRIEPLGALYRSRHHFHNPLRPWAQAGLDAWSLCPPFRLQGEASVRWAQEPNQGVTGHASWLDARRSFLDALTGSAPTDRDTALARTAEILGQQMHLVEDLAVPAHTRNDQHCPMPDGFERWAKDTKNASTVLALAASPIKPAAGIFAFAPPVDDVAHVPVARLWDTEQYRALLDPGITVPGPIGLAEYSNANFFSNNTVFSKAVIENNVVTSGLPYPAATSVVLAPLEKDDQRRYFKKVRDGDLVNHLAVPSALYEALPDALRDHRKGFDDKVFNDYAEKLIPRAVGYSSALLDYFFRGRLDVDLVDTGSGPTLVGTNASSDVLDAGALSVYADTVDGTRVLSSAATAVSAVAPGGALPPVAVTPPDSAERFVAVYTGTLGGEQPAGTFPGAVIGKVLGGYRVEQLFSDGTRWNLRTPKGIFPLPILRSDIADLRWGDADNTLVGRTPFGSGQPNRLRAYRLNRPLGSSDVPLTGDQMVDVVQTADVAFPFGINAGSLQLNSAINHRQYLLSYVKTDTYDAYMNRLSTTYSDPYLDPVVIDSASASFTWPLTLDVARYNNSRGRPFRWQVDQIALTADGRPLALIRIMLTQPPTTPDYTAQFPTKIYVWCGAWTSCPTPPQIQDGPPTGVLYGFGSAHTNHWVLVDLAAGQVVYSSMPGGGIVINNVIDNTQFGQYLSGPYSGLVATIIRKVVTPDSVTYPVDGQNNLAYPRDCTGGDFSGTFHMGDLTMTTGIESASASQYRAELEQAAFPASPGQSTPVLDICVVGSGYLAGAYLGLTWNEPRVIFNDAQKAVRVNDGSERVALLFTQQHVVDWYMLDWERTVAWDPLIGSASVRNTISRGDSWSLVSASRGLAVVSGLNSGLEVVPLEGDGSSAQYAMDSSDIYNYYRALNPAFLYNTQNTRFYRYQPSLFATALPAPLAVGGATSGDYHTIRLK